FSCGQASSTKRVRQQLRIAYAPDHVARVAPERTLLGKQIDRGRMILEVRPVGHRVARDRLREERGGIRRETMAERLRVDRRMLIGVGEGVDGDDLEPGPCRRLRGGARRNSCEQYFHGGPESLALPKQRLVGTECRSQEVLRAPAPASNVQGTLGGCVLRGCGPRASITTVRFSTRLDSPQRCVRRTGC